MATYDDLSSRLTRLSDMRTKLISTAEAFVSSNRADESLLKSVEDLQKRIGAVQNRRETAEEKAATADREFLEQKEVIGPVFTKDRLYTNQDFTFFFFTLAYIIFSLAVIMSVERKISATLGMAFLMLVIFAILRMYA